MAEARSGTATVVAGASALGRGGHGLAPSRRQQHRRGGTRAPPGAASCATHPGTPSPIRIRGGAARGARGGRARVSGGAHHTTRGSVAIKEAEEETERSRLASDLRWRTLAMVQGQPLRWRVALGRQAWKAYAGWSPLTQPPGAEGARHSVRLSRLVAPPLCIPPAQQRQLHHPLPASTVGSLRAHGPGACLLEGIDAGVASDHPQEQLQRFTLALPEVFAFGHAKKHRIQRPWGRREPTPFLTYRADEVMPHMPVRAT
jgi:hypothetical protein